MSEKRPSVRIIVLGDIMRSPRMRNHAISFIQMNWEVKFSGYKPCSTVYEKESRFQLSYINKLPESVDLILPKVLVILIKMIFLSISLLFHLVHNFREDLILVQSPPALPSLIIVWIFALFKRVPVIIDWHNYGYTIIQSASGKCTLISRIYKLFELGFAERFLNSNALVTTKHFCVSNALKHDLYKRTLIHSDVLYDKPMEDFKPTPIDQAHSLFERLSSVYPQLLDSQGNNIFTECKGLNCYRYRVNRPALVVSSCSWTIDDDYIMMVDALELYNSTVATFPNIIFHKLYCFVTGHGPCKEYFVDMIASRNWEHVVVILPWLKWSDYTTLLGCADLGVSLHNSTSGLDLPMKIVDLFGSEVPVLALNYPALSELLPSGLAGCHFSSASQLAQHLQRLLMPKEDFEASGDSIELKQYRQYLHELKVSGTQNWHTHWEITAYPVCMRLVGRQMANKN